MTIYVTRHGQSLTNVDADIHARARGEKVTIDIKNNILTEVGIQQALEYGRWIKDKKIDLIICSPYARTKQTAFCIASVMGTCVPIRYDRDFREIGWEINGKFSRLEDHIGEFDTKQHNVDFTPVVPRKIDRRLQDSRRDPHTLESQREVYDRTIPTLLKTARRHKGKNILIVTHFFVLRSIMTFVHAGHSDHMLGYTPRNLERFWFEESDLITAEAGGPFPDYVRPDHDNQESGKV